MARAPNKQSLFALLNYHLVTGRISRGEYQAALLRRSYVTKGSIQCWRGWARLYPGRAADLALGRTRAGNECL